MSNEIEQKAARINGTNSAFGFVDNRSSSYEDNEVHYGLTKREYFAAMAMQGLMTKDYMKLHIDAADGGQATYTNVNMIAEMSITIADALLTQLSLNK